MERLYERAKKINLATKLRIIERYHKGKGVLMDVGAGPVLRR